MSTRPRMSPARSRTCGPSSANCAFGTPISRSTCTARPAPRSTFRTTSCANCTVSSTCSRTRRNSWRATSSARHEATSTACPRRFSASWSSTHRMAPTHGIARGTPGAWRFSRARSGRCFTSFSAKTCCARTSATRWTSSGSCLTIPVRSQNPNSTRRASSTPTTVISSRMARRPPTRSSGTPTWPPTTSWWSIAIVTSRSCTRSP